LGVEADLAIDVMLTKDGRNALADAVVACEARAAWRPPAP
jgi:hypothetical protein